MKFGSTLVAKLLMSCSSMSLVNNKLNKIYSVRKHLKDSKSGVVPRLILLTILAHVAAVNVKLHIHRVSKKAVQNCFCQNFVKCPPILIIFGRKMAKRLTLCKMFSLSTSPNLRHHTTVLNTDIPNCYTTL